MHSLRRRYTSERRAPGTLELTAFVVEGTSNVDGAPALLFCMHAPLFLSLVVCGAVYRLVLVGRATRSQYEHNQYLYDNNSVLITPPPLQLYGYD